MSILTRAKRKTYESPDQPIALTQEAMSARSLSMAMSAQGTVEEQFRLIAAQGVGSSADGSSWRRRFFGDAALTDQTGTSFTDSRYSISKSSSYSSEGSEERNERIKELDEHRDELIAVNNEPESTDEFSKKREAFREKLDQIITQRETLSKTSFLEKLWNHRTKVAVACVLGVFLGMYAVLYLKQPEDLGKSMAADEALAVMESTCTKTSLGVNWKRISEFFYATINTYLK